MTGICATCGREISFTRGRRLRDHLVNPKDPMGPRCLGRDRVEPPPRRLPDISNRPSKPRKKKNKKKKRVSVYAIPQAFESNRRRH